MNRRAALGVAVREYPLKSGPCDYLLIIDGKACGVVEAKPEGTTLSGVAEQSAVYQSSLPEPLATWGSPLRFGYEASGSEIQFADRVDPDARSRRLFAFHRPETLLGWLKEASSVRLRLTSLPPLETEGLRDCQVEAIEGIEHSLAQDQPRTLIQMATGAGKTFTAANLSYRLLAHAGAKRILFLVDRNNLGRQTLKEFQAFRPHGTGRLFTELYNVQRLGPAGLDGDAKVVVSTIQRVFSQLSGSELSEEEEEASGWENGGTALPRVVSYNPGFPPETFDIVIVDECHRSIYGSWRQVLDYFDAHIIGLTATPSVHTLAFFGKNLVAEYPYERSVADGVNVPFDIFRIRTQIGEHGSRIPAGFEVPKRDRHTRRERYEQLDEDLVYAASDLDRSVIAPNQIRTVLETYRDTIATELFPESHPSRTEVPKTLIFAKDDNHAEEIVKLAREVFGKGNEFAKKITYRVTGVDPEQLISAFRNDYNPRIAVTVDMIATGTDVKPIEVLMFLRDVRSELYFEQMVGRGVRTVNPSDLARVTPDARAKDRFVLIDAVGVTESAKHVARPLERDRTVSFGTLLEQVAAGRSDEDAVSTLAGRLAKLDRKLTQEQKDKVIAATGGTTLTQLAGRLVDAIDLDRIMRLAPSPDQEEAKAAELRETALEPFNDPKLRNLLIELKLLSEVTIDLVSPDVVISTGFDEKAAQELIARFGTFLDEQQDELVALTILYGKPQGAARLTYASLQELRDAMMRPPWLLQPLALWSAYRRLQGDKVRGNPAKVLTDIVALVRFATGRTDSLAPLSSRIAGNFNLWLGREEKAGRVYTQQQLAWLEAIRDHLSANIELDLRDLQDLPQFTQRGGVIAARTAFGPRLEAVIEDVTQALVA
ncbi:DEAD/DEAH box helicase family protein [Altererythrobacter sp. TH136]|uniref:type I restriction endonuclease subunit R n=1 Tax=Altererythrobacter sp. TH136 TaxID=2067415 RepID=UPI001AEFEEC2|nr:DEAD/DEAH box helicase family protein [Altererythrobacter sp. TH136]